MDFNGFKLSDFPPKMDTSFAGEMIRQNQKLVNSIKPLSEILAEEIKPILEGNQKVVTGLNDNYAKLNDLYLLKEKELEDSKQEAEKAKKYNTKMLVIALISAGIALASLVATILIAVL